MLDDNSLDGNTISRNHNSFATKTTDFLCDSVHITHGQIYHGPSRSCKILSTTLLLMYDMHPHNLLCMEVRIRFHWTSGHTTYNVSTVRVHYVWWKSKCLSCGLTWSGLIHAKVETNATSHGPCNQAARTSTLSATICTHVTDQVT